MELSKYPIPWEIQFKWLNTDDLDVICWEAKLVIGGDLLTTGIGDSQADALKSAINKLQELRGEIK